MAGFRMRKSIKLVPGVRLNVSKSGLGVSAGEPGARYSVHSSGRRTVSLGSGIVPGVYYQDSKGGRGSSKGGRAGTQAAPPITPKKPGLFAPKGEKELYKAVKAQDAQAMKRVGEQHPDFRVPAYSLAGGRWDDVIELTDGIKNEDDAGALLCVFRGQAFREQGFHDAAHEALKEALRAPSRAAPIRHLALAQRAQNYLAQGKRAQARKDLERILAEDSSYEGVRERLSELTG